MKQMPQLLKEFQPDFFGGAGSDSMPEKPPVSADAPSVKIEKFVPKLSFVTRTQREQLISNPYASFLRGKTLEEISIVDKDLGSKLYKKSKTKEGEEKLETYRKAYYSAITIATEALLTAVDERFIHHETGLLFFVVENGLKQIVRYNYSPYYFERVDNQYRTHTPTLHLEFRSEKPNPISETGYFSHFFGQIPIDDVTSFGDFLIKQIRYARKVKSTIIFEGKIYEFNPAEFPLLADKKKTKRQRCRNCRSKLDSYGDCPKCQPDWEEMPEE